MRNSCRFAVAVHILTLLSCKEGRRVTSDTLALSVNTNPVVIRRVLLALQRRGIVETQKGAGAGSRLTRCPDKITLSEVYEAVEPSVPFLMPARTPSKECPVGQCIQSVLRGLFRSVERAMEKELSQTTLENLRQAVHSCASISADHAEVAPPVVAVRGHRRAVSRHSVKQK